MWAEASDFDGAALELDRCAKKAMRLWTQDDMRRDFFTQFPHRKEHALRIDRTKPRAEIIDETTGERFTIEKRDDLGVFYFNLVIDVLRNSK